MLEYMAADRRHDYIVKNKLKEACSDVVGALCLGAFLFALPIIASVIIDLFR